MNGAATAIPRGGLAQMLRKRTSALHERAESATFVRRLVAGRVDCLSYARLIEGLHFVYSEMETALDRHRLHPVLSMLDVCELRRRQALERDLRWWFGPCWRDVTFPSPATSAYVARIRTAADEEPLLLVGHMYTRYLGDLSGGEILGRAVARAFGSSPDSGAAFHSFDAVTDRRTFRDLYRARLDELPLDARSTELVLKEAETAFLLNICLFEELESVATRR